MVARASVRSEIFKFSEKSSTSLIPTPGAGELSAAMVDGILYTKDEDGNVAVWPTEIPVTVTPNDDSGAASSIPAGVKNVIVAPVTNDANDWIVLPPIADVPIGFTITIACNAGTNFELRTPATSGTKVNDVDSDGSQEYLCTDTDLITVTKHTATGWVAVSETKLGARRAAVVPD